MNHGWEKKRFDDCITKVKCPPKLQTKDYEDKGLYKIVSQEDGLINGYTNNVSVIFKHKNPVVVFGDHTRCVKYVDFDFALGADGIKILSPIDDILPKFFAYTIRSFKIPSLGYARHYRLLRNSNVPIPSKEQQQAIVAELDALNEAIEMKRKQLKALDALAQALFYDTFGDPVENPKGWEIKTLSGIATIQTGATPSRKKQNNFAGSIPWVKTTEVHNCDIFSTEEHISETALNESNCKIFPIDTILIAMYGQGKTRGQVARLKIAASTNQACAAILPNSDLNQTFLFRLLRCSYEDLRGKAIGGNQKNLNLLLIKKYPVILPPLPLQQHFAAQVEEIERGKENVEATIARLQTLLDSRMDYWFND